MTNKKKKKSQRKSIPDLLVHWVGTTNSLIVHTAFFILSFLAHWIIGLSIDSVLLILTTVVSLEAIYLAIFIQRSVNQQSLRLNDVEESLDDVEESLDDVEESLDDVEESIDDVEESISRKHHTHTASTELEKSLREVVKELRILTADLKQIEKIK